MTSKRGKSVFRAARSTVFYIMITGIVMVILLPVFFIVSLSFLSTREAYRFPLPLLPSLITKMKLEPGERGNLLSVWDRVEDDYLTHCPIPPKEHRTV